MALQDFDPNQAYQEICEAYVRVRGMTDHNLNASYASTAKMAAGWADLNEWLSAGGYPPAAWDPFSKQPEEEKA